ncbi:uncharacterized protein QC764_0107750 [Podospora pseudoanserina]|uniref:Uncharacterized protein n=1 Tax=Podospora pseudoanserina TaxID=2609844 RepID=A0ABR0HLL0_9PEZI|nr:hypothetical protein QC764_0107750 [Podospora pseudoanserina]
MPISIQPQCGQKKTGQSRPGKGDPDPEIGLYVEGISISGPGITSQKQGPGRHTACNLTTRTQRNPQQLRKLKRPVAAEYWLVGNCSQKVLADHPSHLKPNPGREIYSSLKPAAAPPPITGGWSSKVFKN